MSTDTRAPIATHRATHLQEPEMIRHLIATVLAAFAFNAFAAVEANRANQAELETVKGIGPGLSGKILEARKSGDFKSWADMVERVPGIGDGNAARFSQAGLTVGGAAYAAATKVEKAPAAKPAEKAPKKAP
jgi:competence protein ComEA